MSGGFCERCANPAMFACYASYDHAPAALHPEHARYPAAMIRSCVDHVGEAMAADGAAPGSTRQWVVELIGEGPHAD